MTAPTRTFPRRLFLQLTGAASGVGVLASQRPARAGPKKAKTLTDTGRGTDRFLADPPPPSGGDLFHAIYGAA